MGYKTMVGLEIHCELLTKSKIFCGCTTEFGGQPNTHCCPTCAGLPGELPRLNKGVVEYAAKACLALNCEIANSSSMERKSYYYADLPKGYQLSQLFVPLGARGYLDIQANGQDKRIRIRRIHMEEDVGKLVHDQSHDGSLVDYNRSGVPLIEIVTEPDISSAQEAEAFLTKLKAILQYIGVSDCKMEEGSLRCDVNITVKDTQTGKATKITEVKNLNSFKAVYKAIEYEEARHRKILEEGRLSTKQTRRWNDDLGKTTMMRTKGESQDYRFFSDASVLSVEIDDEEIQRIKASLPEMPDAKYKRFIEEYGLPEYDAGVLTGSKDLSEFFEDCAKIYGDAKTVSNWVMGDLLRLIKEKDVEIRDIKITPQQLASLLEYMDKGTISGAMAKKVFEEMFESGKDPGVIIKERGMVQISDEGKLREIIEEVIAQNPKSVEDYKGGKKKALGFLVGQTMKATKGSANPQLVNKLLKELLQS
ncbi:MAG TPA: Asp-tRNA(Asn)/Glu-tRNA(Gln) amidotransferase subunit GatB [Clostridiales bacterium]|nr:Asp-tRNA(Asn)/Glu-tRNA(Gln) amidotransferase subunit GatB [Clostridiales bacterium]